MDLHDLRCSFCGSSIDKDTGTLGAGIGICHGCVNQAADHLAAGLLVADQTANEERLSEYRCSFCDTRSAHTSLLFTAKRHFVCENCVNLIRREIIGSTERQAPTSMTGIYLL